MTDDLLEQATRALRARVDGASPRAAASEEQILERLEAPRPLRRVRIWPLALAAVFVGSSVWAASSGSLGGWAQRLFVPDEVEELVGSSGERGRGEAADAAREATTSEGNSPIELASERAPVETSAPVEERASADAPDPTAPRAPAPGSVALSSAEAGEAAALGSSAAPVLPAASPSAAPSPRELELYETAHELHFRKQDYARALAAWDAYLEHAPRGTLALEARFHRAVCLVRVGRGEEARPILRAFADGAYGGYRSREAARLLGEIGGP